METYNKDLIQKYESLRNQKQLINKELTLLEKDYIDEFCKSKGLNSGDLVQVPNGTFGFLSISCYTKYDKVDFCLKAVKKDGTPSLNNISCLCELDDLKLIIKAENV